MVEQRTENPCVGSSILPSTTKSDLIGSLFCFSKEPTGSHLPFYHEIKAKERILAVSALPYSNTKLSQRKGSVSSSVSGANLFQFMVVFQRVCPAEHGNLYGEKPSTSPALAVQLRRIRKLWPAGYEIRAQNRPSCAPTAKFFNSVRK